MVAHFCEDRKDHWTTPFKWGSLWYGNYVSIKLLPIIFISAPGCFYFWRVIKLKKDFKECQFQRRVVTFIGNEHISRCIKSAVKPVWEFDKHECWILEWILSSSRMCCEKNLVVMISKNLWCCLHSKSVLWARTKSGRFSSLNTGVSKGYNNADLKGRMHRDVYGSAIHNS